MTDRFWIGITSTSRCAGIDPAVITGRSSGGVIADTLRFSAYRPRSLYADAATSRPKAHAALPWRSLIPCPCRRKQKPASRWYPHWRYKSSSAADRRDRCAQSRPREGTFPSPGAQHRLAIAMRGARRPGRSVLGFLLISAAARRGARSLVLIGSARKRDTRSTVLLRHRSRAWPQQRAPTSLVARPA